MLAGRFLLIVPVLAIAGGLARKQPLSHAAVVGEHETCRLLACVAEEHHDAKGLIWPVAVGFLEQCGECNIAWLGHPLVDVDAGVMRRKLEEIYG